MSEKKYYNVTVYNDNGWEQFQVLADSPEDAIKNYANGVIINREFEVSGIQEPDINEVEGPFDEPWEDDEDDSKR